MEDEKRVIEINGIKMEVDLRHARRVDSFRVGEKVRVLIKEYQSYRSYAGMIVGFDDFKKRPTIIVAYVKPGAYESDPLRFEYINQDSEDVELCAMMDDFIVADKSVIIEAMDRKIEKSREEILEMEAKKAYFLKYFGAYFGDADKENKP